METIASLPSHKGVEAVNFYLLVRNTESLARQILHLFILDRLDLTTAERAELLLDTYGNLLVTDYAFQHVVDYAKALKVWLQGQPSPFRISVSTSVMKFKEIDQLVEIFKGWESDSSIDSAKLFDDRLREYYAERYDHRENLIDWDIHFKLNRLGADIIYSKEFLTWRTTGIAFPMREGGHIRPNMTLITTLNGSYV